MRAAGGTAAAWKAGASRRRRGSWWNPGAFGVSVRPVGPVFAPPAPLILVPAEAHVEAALAEANRRSAGETGPRVRSVRGFERDALAVLAPGRAPASPIAVALATHAAVKEAARDRSLPGAAETRAEATAAALAATIDRAIGALRRAGRPTFAMRRSLGVWASTVMDRTDARLREAGWFDARGSGALLARAVLSAPDEALAELGVLGGVVLEGVFPWEGDELTWLEALHRRSRAAGGAGVVLRLPRFTSEDGGPGGPLAGAADPLADVLERRWSTLEDAPEITWVTRRFGRVIGVRGARTAEAEARAVAAAVLDALAAGLPPERIAVAVPRTAGDAAQPIAAALTEARVPFAEARGRSIAACPDGRAALSLLAQAEGPFTRDGLLEVLRAPGLHAGVWVEANDEAEAAARAVRLAARLRDVPVDVDGSGRLFVDGLTDLVKDEPEDAWMPRALDRMVKSIRWIAEGGTLREGLGRFAKLVDQAKLGQPSAVDLAAALGDEKRGHGSLSLASLGENESAVRRLREVVNELGRAAEILGLGRAPASAAELRALVTGLAERTGARAGGTAARAGAVRIGRAEELAGLPFDRVIASGLVESAYGDDGDEEDLLGGEEERAEGRARARAPRRTLALASALASAPEVVLAYATGDDDERDKPHALVVDALSRVPLVTEPPSRVAPRASLLGPRSAELVRLAGGRPPIADLADRVKIERERYAFFMDPRTAPGDFTGRVRMDGLREVLPALVGGASGETSIAVTSIEKAAGCAFAGFARRVLRISRKEDALEAGDARERGTMLHRALSAAFEAARDAAYGAGTGDGGSAALVAQLERSVDGVGVAGGRDARVERGPGASRPAEGVGPGAGWLVSGPAGATVGSDPGGSLVPGALDPGAGWEVPGPDEARPGAATGAGLPVLVEDVVVPLHVPPANHQTPGPVVPRSPSPSSWSPEERRAVFLAARDAAERALGMDRVVSPLRREAIRSAVRDALGVLVRAWDDEDPMRFHLAEQQFGRGAPDPWGPLALEPDGAEPDAPRVFVDGRIDRIDLSADGVRVRVIDYKTGRPPEGEARRIALQLPLYGSAAARALGATKMEAMYVRVTARGLVDESPKRPPDRAVKPEDLQERTREARRAVLALWEGRVAPRPAFLALCASCEARDVCRRPAVMPIDEAEERA